MFNMIWFLFCKGVGGGGGGGVGGWGVGWGGWGGGGVGWGGGGGGGGGALYNTLLYIMLENPSYLAIDRIHKEYG